MENDLKNYNRQAGTRISSMKSIKASSGKIQKPAGNSDLNNGSHNQANGTNNNSSQNAKLSRKEFDNSFDKFSEELMNAYSTIDPDNPEAFLKKTIPLFRKLGELLQSDPDNDPKMKELAKILTGFNEKSDIDEILAKMTKINELMIRD